LQSFEPLLSLLATIPDPRRAEGKLYQLRHVLLFSIFAMISGANSYRIPGSRQDPKIGGEDYTKVVCDRIAKFGPSRGDFVA
jgi:hypothetical protein